MSRIRFGIGISRSCYIYMIECTYFQTQSTFNTFILMFDMWRIESVAVLWKTYNLDRTGCNANATPITMVKLGYIVFFH